MKTNFRFIVMVIALALAALACQTVTSSTTTEEAKPGVPTAVPVLFEDDFSDPDSGWDRYSDAEGVSDYENGGYRLYVNKANWYFWSNPGLNLTNVSIEVDATKVSGDDENDFGVICRYQDTDNFYFFTIGSDGYYGISKFVDGEELLVGMEELQFNDNAINTGNSSNHIRVDCNGTNLALYVNGQVLADVTDSEFSTGDVGLIAGAYDTPGTDVLFDNFMVRKP